MRWMCGLSLVVPCLVLTPVAAGESPHEPAPVQIASLETAFAAGDYAEVTEEAPRLATADSYALTARAILAEALCATNNPPTDVLKRAEAFARSALKLDPNHPEARIQLAVALSLQARTMDLGEARRSGYGELTRELAEAVLADDPSNPYANSYLAVWNIEVRRKGGSLGAVIMGASVKDARRHFARAVAARADDAGIYWQYARALAALDVKRYRGEIEDALAAAEGCPIDSELEAVMQQRARALAAMIASGAGDDAIEDWAAEQL